MLRAFRAFLARWQFKRATAAFDRRIEAARKAHGHVKPELDAKTRALHEALARAVRG